MFGTTPSGVPANSPHLGRNGSWSEFNGTGEYVVGNGHLHPTDTNDSKTSSGIPTGTIAQMQVPIVKVLAFFIWLIVCCKTGWSSVMRTTVKDLVLYEAFLYYNPPFLVAMMVWLWGINLWVFSQSEISIARIFYFEQSYLTHKEVWKCASWMTIAVATSMTTYLYLYSHGEVSLAAKQPVLLYSLGVTTLILPFDALYMPSRYYLLRTLWRIMLPLEEVTFSEFFLADVLTSMSKVLSDMERSVCRMVHRQVEADLVCGSQSAAIPLVLVLPYLFRLFQCIRQYKCLEERDALFNAAKYSTSVVVVIISAFKSHDQPETLAYFLHHAWLCAGVVNSLYSFAWDVTRDWNLSRFTQAAFNFRQENLFSRTFHQKGWVCGWVILSNLILRCTWTYKLSPHLRQNHLTVFVITALEIFRRFQWAFFRIENEWSKRDHCRSVSHFHAPRIEDVQPDRLR